MEETEDVTGGLEAIPEHGVLQSRQSEVLQSQDSVDSLGSSVDADWQAEVVEAASNVVLTDYTSSTLAAPKLEVIEEHEILETAPAPVVSPTTEIWADQSTIVVTEDLLGDSSKPQFFLGSPVVAVLKGQEGVGDLTDDHSGEPGSRRDSFGAQSHYSRQDSQYHGHGRDAVEPLLIGTITDNGLSEPTLPKSRSESHGFGGVFRALGVSQFTRRLFGSTTGMSRAESLENVGVPEGSRQQRSQQHNMIGSSRNSISSEMSTNMPVSSRGFPNIKGSGRKHRSPMQITTPAGIVIPRSKRFLSKGTAGFLHSKGTSAINLRAPEDSQELPSPCAECPYCRKFLKFSQLQPGRTCPCQICLIIDESNQKGPSSLLHKQNATRKTSGPGGTSKHSKKSIPVDNVPERPHQHHVLGQAGLMRVPSAYGLFCSHCSQMNLNKSSDDKRASIATPCGQVGLAFPHPVQADVYVDSAMNARIGEGVSMASSIESLFVGAQRQRLPLNRELSVQTSLTVQQDTDQHKISGGRHSLAPQSLYTSQLSVACPSMINGHLFATGNHAPFCRICHQTQDKESECLISPCRCLGTLKCVHESCLQYWLEVSYRSYRRQPICEFCGFHYRRLKTFRRGNVTWPKCSMKDKILHSLAVLSVLSMIIAAFITLICFQMEEGASYGASQKGQNEELSTNEIITLIAGLTFFLAFFLSMYSEVKAKHTIFKLAHRWWKMNNDLKILEYEERPSMFSFWRRNKQKEESVAKAKLSDNSKLESEDEQKGSSSARSKAVDAFINPGELQVHPADLDVHRARGSQHQGRARSSSGMVRPHSNVSLDSYQN